MEFNAYLFYSLCISTIYSKHFNPSHKFKSCSKISTEKIHVWLKCPVKLLSYLLTFDSYCIKTLGCNLVKQFYFTLNITYNEQSIFKLCAMD